MACSGRLVLLPRPYPPEFRGRAVACVRAGKQAKQTVVELGIHPVTLSNWIRQADVDQGRRPGVSPSESAELRAAKRRIRELETERRPTFGAHAFSVAGGDGLNPVTDHGVSAPGGTGYLDPRTESLKNVALATTGQGSKVTAYVPPEPTPFQQALIDAGSSGVY